MAISFNSSGSSSAIQPFDTDSKKEKKGDNITDKVNDLSKEKLGDVTDNCCCGKPRIPFDCCCIDGNIYCTVL